ncbi:MAG: hypothetical protein U1F29_16130 [Planctomycetota bacterium]
MKIKERYVYLECFGCATAGRSRYTTHERLKATELERKKCCRFCREH